MPTRRSTPTGPRPTDTSTPLLTRPEVAERLHLSISALKTMASERRGPRHLVIGRKAMYPEGEVAAWLAEQAEQQAPGWPA